MINFKKIKNKDDMNFDFDLYLFFVGKTSY